MLYTILYSIYSITNRVDIMFKFVLLIKSFIIKKLQSSAKELLSSEGSVAEDCLLKI